MAALRQIQQAQLPPAQPAYISRGHKAQIHALQFLRHNSRLLTGDAQGIIILWDLVVKRPKAVWQGHKGGILGFGVWSDDKIVSHGRDGKLIVWQLRKSDEDGLDTDLPAEESTKGDWKQPWILHSLQVHTLNFCAFAMCKAQNAEEILVATPTANEGCTVIHELPPESARYLVPPSVTEKTGMVMALRLLYREDALHLVTGYESGLSSVQRLKPGTQHTWETIASCKPHTQPILSLDMLPLSNLYFTSGADAIIAKASLAARTEKEALKTISTKHSGQQSLTVRSDGKIFATAGWDGRIRVYSTKTLREVAVLKWHKEGCYAVAFAEIGDPTIAKNNDSALTLGDNEDYDETAKSLAKTGQVFSVRQQREMRTTATHWLAAGSKDGNVSLWDIF